MAIVRKNVNKIGSVWTKKVFVTDVTSGSNGSEIPIAGLVLPYYMKVGYAYAKWYGVETSSDGVDPWVFSEFNLSGRYGNIDSVQLFGSSLDTQGELIDAIEKYLPLTTSQIDSDTTAALDAGITGRETKSPQGKATEFLDRQYKLGFPETAYPTNAHKVRRHFSGSYKGHCRTDTMVDITQPSLFMIGATNEAPRVNSDYGEVLVGDVAANDALYESYLRMMPGYGVDISEQAVPYNTKNELSALEETMISVGWDSGSSMVADETFKVRCYLTARLDIYEASTGAMVVAP